MSINIQNDSIKRICSIIQGLKTLSRDGRSDEIMPENLEEVIDETLSLCLTQAKSQNIDVKVTNNLSDFFIKCQRVELGQVILNLMGNAIDEVKGKENSYINIDTYLEGDQVVISFENSGVLIAKDIEKKIFAPFLPRNLLVKEQA